LRQLAPLYFDGDRDLTCELMVTPIVESHSRNFSKNFLEQNPTAMRNLIQCTCNSSVPHFDGTLTAESVLTVHHLMNQEGFRSKLTDIQAYSMILASLTFHKFNSRSTRFDLDPTKVLEKVHTDTHIEGGDQMLS
jgi:uncharacterized membrane protein